jgi:hypothetical protein
MLSQFFRIWPLAFCLFRHNYSFSFALTLFGLLAFQWDVLANTTYKQGSDGRVVAYPSSYTWTTKAGSDGRVVAYPSSYTWTTKTGSDGRVIAYPSSYTWKTKTGSDGRVVPYPSSYTWTSKAGTDGRVVPYPSGYTWTTKTGSDGRVVPYPSSGNYLDWRYLIIQEVQKTDPNIDGLRILTMMGFIDEKSNSSSSSPSSYDEGFAAASFFMTNLLTANLDSYGVTNLQELYEKGTNDGTIWATQLLQQSLLNDFNASSLPHLRQLGVEEGNASGIAFVKANPNIHGLYAEVDLNASKETANAEGRLEGKALGRAEGEQIILNNLTAYNLFTSKQYEEALQSQETNATPYTASWFYVPDQGWMWSQKETYPWFYDANSSNWMYFESGHEKPRFYNYATKDWMTVE